MGKKKFETSKKREAHFSGKLEGLFKKARETSAVASLTTLLNEKENQNGDSSVNKKIKEFNPAEELICPFKSKSQSLEITNLEDSDSVGNCEGPRNMMSRSKYNTVPETDTAFSGGLDVDKDGFADKPNVLFDFGCDYACTVDENQFSFDSVNCGSVFYHDWVMEGEDGTHLARQTGCDGVNNLSTDVSELWSEHGVTEELFKGKLFDS